MKKAIYSLMVAVLVAGLVLGCAPTPKDEPITLKAVTFIPVDNPMVKGGWIFGDLVNELSGGELTIDFIGGPEVIPGFDQPKAVMEGSIDIIYNVTAYSAPLLPEADILHLSEYTPWEERESGFYDYMIDIFKNMNTYYLGRMMTPNAGFYFWVNDPTERPADLAGRKMRTAGLYNEFMLALGIVPVTVAIPEVYSALERGIVDGFGQPIAVAYGMHWTDVTKYLIDHMFYNQNGVILINLDVWNKLSRSQQDLLKEAAVEQEHKTADYIEEVIQDYRQGMQAEGVQFVKYSPADAKYFIDLAYSTSWEETKGKVSPEMYAKLREFLMK